MVHDSRVADGLSEAGDGVMIDEATLDEGPAVASLLVSVFGTYAAHLPPGVADAYLADVADVEGRRDHSALLVARRGDRILGSVTWLPDASLDGHPWPSRGSVIRLLAVHPSARGRGLARSLVTACIERARQAGLSFVGLHTAPFMTGATALYESMGFVRAPEWDFEATRYYGSSGSEPVPGIAYVLYRSGIS
jgi:ribosomal protein S18 acetylase RimI-like enzyme